ncbi:MAG TPA: amidohydrolase family protein [Chloroflexota bacterium]
MIVDGHAHAFPRLGAGAGFRSPDEHRRYLQRHMSTHPQGGRRARDNAPVSGEMLRNPDSDDLDALPDINFRVGNFGRLEWDAPMGVDRQGEPCYLQFLPPHLEDTTARPERMLAQMQYLGVDRALLQSGRLYGITNRYLAEVVGRWPDRFRGCATVDEARADEQIGALREAVGGLGLSALYFSNDGFAAANYERHFDDRRYFPFWEAVEALGVPVLWDIRFALRRGQADYMAEAARLRGHLRRFPRIENVLTHGLPASAFDGGRIPDDLWATLREPNLTVELLFPLLHGATWEYPYREAQAIVRDLHGRLGPTKLLWGSDLPNVERSCTYRQSLDYLRRHCDFIPPADLDLIVGGNADRLYFRSGGS